jgi:hypothetical protein
MLHEVLTLTAQYVLEVTMKLKLGRYPTGRTLAKVISRTVLLGAGTLWLLGSRLDL